MCQNCQDNYSSKSNSSFIFGLILGAIIGAIIAIVIYRKNKGKIFNELQSRLTQFFTPKTTKAKTVKAKKASPEVILEKPIIKKTRPKVFIRK